MVTVYEDLGTAVNKAFENMKGDFTEAFFKGQIAGPMGLAISSLEEYARNYKRGYIYGSTSSNPWQLDARLKKLAIFLYALGFSEEDEFQKKVIEGIREVAAKRGERFEYPPSEGNGISYLEIKRRFIEQKEVAKGRSAEETNADKEKSVADRVNKLLGMEVSTKPDNHYRAKDVIIREVYIKGFTNFSIEYTFGVDIRVAPQRSETGEVLHPDTYRVNYAGVGYSVGKNSRALQALIEFLSNIKIKGQKVRIAYNMHRLNGRVTSNVQMIAPVGSDIIYFRDGGMLKPYNIKEMRVIGV